MGKPFAVLLALSSLLFASAAWSSDPQPAARPASIQWKYKLGDVVVTRPDADGKPTHALDMNVLDYFLETIAGHAEQHPPRFDSKAEEKDVADKLVRLTTLLNELDDGTSVNVDILRREAFAFNLAHDLGFPGADQKTTSLYQRLLKQTPDEPAANYLYGMFLADTDATRPQSVPYLEKAVELGVKKANFTLGVVYVSLGDEQKGLDCLQQYSKDFPDDPRTKQVIAAAKSGNMQH